MENAITMSLYLKLTGIAFTATIAVMGYWIKEIRTTTKQLDEHKANDEKEFNTNQRANDACHADIRRELGQVKGGAELAVAGLKGNLDTMNGKLDTLIGLFKEGINSK